MDTTVENCTFNINGRTVMLICDVTRDVVMPGLDLARPKPNTTPADVSASAVYAYSNDRGEFRRAKLVFARWG